MFQNQDQLPVFSHASTVTHEMKHQMCSEVTQVLKCFWNTMCSLIELQFVLKNGVSNSVMTSCVRS